MTRSTTPTATRSEAEIRELLRDWADAVRQKDLERLMRHYAPACVTFDAWGPLRIDLATLRDHWSQCFAGHDGPIGFEHHELHVTAGEEVAFARCLVHMHGKIKDHEPAEHEFWGRGTIGFEKIDGRWLITHEHDSAPFNPMSGRACLDLKP